MMPRKRKQKLCVKKNEKRKKAMKKPSQCTVAFKVSVPTCKINLPNPLLTRAKDTYQLYNVLNNSNSFSSMWSLTTEDKSDTTVLFCHKLKCNSSQLSSAVIMTVVIQNNFEWSLSCMAHLIDKNSSALLGQPELLQMPQDVADLLTLLDCYSICTGNSDERFVQLVDKRKGVIKDQSGKYIYIYIYIYSLNCILHTVLYL